MLPAGSESCPTGPRHPQRPVVEPGPIVHEAGEFAYLEKVGLARFTEGTAEYNRDELVFRRAKGMIPDFRRTVSSYAETSHTEFVAEVFTALALGRRDVRNNKQVMELYKQLDGPEL